MEKSNKTGLIIGSLLVGAAIGTALGVLFAPNKGSITRKNLLSLNDDLKEKLNENFNTILGKITTNTISENAQKAEINKSESA